MCNRQATTIVSIHIEHMMVNGTITASSKSSRGTTDQNMSNSFSFDIKIEFKNDDDDDAVSLFVRFVLIVVVVSDDIVVFVTGESWRNLMTL